MSIFQINSNLSDPHSTKNNSGSVIKGGNVHSLLINVPNSNTQKSSGSSAIDGNDTYKIYGDGNFPNFNTKPISFQVTEQIAGLTNNDLDSPISFNIFPENNTIKNNSYVFNLGNGNIVSKPTYLNQMITTESDIFCNSLDIEYKDPFSDIDVPREWRWDNRWSKPIIPNPWSQEGLWVMKNPNGNLVSEKDEWLNVDPTIHIYIYYTDKETNVFLPGVGWKANCGWGGHRCDNAEFDVYIKIMNKFYNAGSINLNNIDPTDDTIRNQYIQNAGPHDRFIHFQYTIPDSDYIETFLKQIYYCDGLLQLNGSGYVTLISKSGVNHAPALTIGVTIGDYSSNKRSYLLAPHFYIKPICTNSETYCSPGYGVIPGCSNVVTIGHGPLDFCDLQKVTPRPLKDVFSVIGNKGSGSSTCIYPEEYEANEICRPENGGCPGWEAAVGQYTNFDDSILPNGWNKMPFAEGYMAVKKLPTSISDTNDPIVQQLFSEWIFIKNNLNFIEGSTYCQFNNSLYNELNVCCPDPDTQISNA